MFLQSYFHLSPVFAFVLQIPVSLNLRSMVMDDEAILGLGELWHYVGKKWGRGKTPARGPAIYPVLDPKQT